MIYRFAVNNIEYGYVQICAEDVDKARALISEAVENGHFACNSNEVEVVSLDEVCDNGKQTGDAYGLEGIEEDNLN